MKEINITSNSDLDAELKSGKYLLLKAYTTWCGPCKMLAKEFTKVCEAINNEPLILASCDVDECPEVKSRFNVNSVPTLILLKGKKILNTVSMFMTKDKIIKFIHDNCELDLSTYLQ